MGHFVPGGILVLVAGLFDLLDGAVARFTKRSTKFGAILDSTVDRVSEAAILAGLLVWYVRQQASLEGVGLEIVLVLIFAVLVSSFLVSYLRARAEGLGLQCQIGLFTRAERVIVLAIGLLVDQVFVALCILVAFVSITVVQRLVYLRKQAATGGD
jgi:CDP-diacylglycerol--glycerol-3-phosphate 3-phosphatidyltransferase